MGGAVFFIRLEINLFGEDKFLDFSVRGSHKHELKFQKPKAFLHKWLRMDATEESYKRAKFLSYLGFTEKQFEEKSDQFGSLDVLTAANILAGPFEISFTNHPAQHLTFSGSCDNPVIKLLSMEQIKILYIPQRVGIAR